MVRMLTPTRLIQYSKSAMEKGRQYHRSVMVKFGKRNEKPPEDVQQANVTRARTTVHSSLSAGPIDYTRGWAWQQVLLHQRLFYPHEQQQQHCGTVLDDLQPDTILLLEHLPVYTLGRGADDANITVDIPDRHRLSRSCRLQRHSGSARLSMDKSLLSSSSSSQTTLIDSVQYLSEMATPVMAPNGVPIYRIDRGGEVTFHGPGQLVVYPLLNLKRYPLKPDLHWYLRQIEQVIIDTLQDDYDIKTMRDCDNTGVWYAPQSQLIRNSCAPPDMDSRVHGAVVKKIAAVGVSASRWMTTHGFALNVQPTLGYFDASYIIPCGLHGKHVTSMEHIWRDEGRVSDLPTVKQVARSVLNKIESVFGIEIDQNAIIDIH